MSAEFTPFQHLVRALWGRTGGSKRIVAVKITSQIDASGNHAPRTKEKWIVIAGLSACEPQWERFENRWRSMLAMRGLNEIHASHLSTSKNRELPGYESLFRRDEAVGATFLECEKLIEEEMLVGTYASIRVADMERILEKPGFARWLTDNHEESCAYPVGALFTCHAVRSYFDARGMPTDSMRFVVEAGDYGEEALRAMVRKRDQYLQNRLSIEPGFDPQTGYKMPPFQAVDVYAWLSRKPYRVDPSEDKSVEAEASARLFDWENQNRKVFEYRHLEAMSEATRPLWENYP